MAEFKTTMLTNLEAKEMSFANVHQAGTRIRRKAEQYAIVAATHADDDVIRYFRVRSSDLIHSILVTCPDLGATTAMDIGLYTIDDGAVVDRDLFATGVSLSGGALSRAEQRYEVLAINTVNQRVWELLGLAQDPLLEYDFAITFSAEPDGTGDLVIEVLYSAGD